MIECKVPTKDLHRMVYNTLLYSKKDTAAQGRTLWARGDGKVRITAFDDYFALSDIHTDGVWTEPSFYLMELDDLKALELTLRDDENPRVDLSTLPLISAVTGSPMSRELWQADALCYPEGWLKEDTITMVAMAPDRLRKLSLIKPGKFPIDLRVFADPGADAVIAFRCGPTVRGAMAPVNREDLAKIYTGEEIWK